MQSPSAVWFPLLHVPTVTAVIFPASIMQGTQSMKGQLAFMCRDEAKRLDVVPSLIYSCNKKLLSSLTGSEL